MIWMLALVLAAGCAKESGSDAYGQFETDDVMISSEMGGKLLQFEAKEGMTLQAGQQIGQVDTLQLHLKKAELESSIKSIRSNLATLDAQANVYKTQLETANKNLKRIQALVNDKAATTQQLDDIEGSINMLNAQIEAVKVQRRSVYAEIETMETRIAQVEDQIDRAAIINPINGIVITNYAEPNELVGQGSPLYQIANLEVLELKVYVSGAQLPNVKLGSDVEVLVDKDADSNQSLTGTVSWIASEAEFTPNMIQTKEERVTQVYAVKIRVPNRNGVLKIGMPGEVNF